ncbi:MAG: cytochrome c family protein [SAR324 cluster bacterium]|nr:cytochrome c family protein [SAR324 cluster bacterium]MBL7034312.1 cytochrome c family protein [SAR324 cluster bacterium]
MLKIRIPHFILLTIVLFTTVVIGNILALPPVAEAAGFMGHKKKKGCTKCHKQQYKSWKKMRHAKAMKTLMPGEFAEEKIKAKLDPDKNYIKDKKCLKCHTTGLDKGGYSVGNKKKMRSFYAVGCEECHGKGKKYQKVKNKYEQDDFPRDEVIKAGMKYGEKEVCEKCHNDDSPFNAALDPKYAFDYKKMLKKGTHKHFRLKKHSPRKGSEWLYED